MYEVTKLAVNGGAHVDPENHADFDVAIKSRYCKVCYIKIVQLAAGAMDMDFEIWESTAARNAGLAVRTNLYLLKCSRSIELLDTQGAQYGENLNPPIPYKDRDTTSMTPTGTITVVNGSNAIVGAGTSFLSWCVGDKIQLPDGNWYAIATITDNTHLTISIVYPGGNASGITYKTLDEERTYTIHCKIYNRTGGTASDFDVSLKIADTSEEVV